MRNGGIACLVLSAACSGGDLGLPGDPNENVPVELRAFSGDGQSALAGDPVPHPLVVQALNDEGRPVPGANVTFEFVDPPAGAEIAPPSTATDSSGRASAEVRLGRPVGDQPVEARLDGPDAILSVQFSLTALPPNRGGGGDDDGGGDAGAGDDGQGGGGANDDDNDDDHEKGKNDNKGKGKNGNRGKGKNKGHGGGG